MTTELNLLDDGLIRVRDGSGIETARSLPSVLEALGGTDTLEFVGLRAHQQHAWHSFLVQLAAIALHCADTRVVKQPASRWRSWLLDLAGSNARAWALVNANLAEPAFMQPPVPKGSLDDFSLELRRTPDDSDVVITAKNHDVKSRRMRHSRPDHWVYALISLQTMGAYSGRSWYSIARMNGGSSSRPSLGASPGFARGARWQRDVEVLLDSRETMLGLPAEFAPEGGHSLLWLLAWDGASSLTLTSLDPFFIEVSRRLRLEARPEGLVLRSTGTDCPRIAAKAIHGNTGDIWTPVDVAKGSALTASARTFHYSRLQTLLFGSDFKRGTAQTVRWSDGPLPWLVAQVLVGGNCVTDGYRERWLPLTPAVRRRLGTQAGETLLASEAAERVAIAERVRRGVLRPALLRAIQGAPDKIKGDDARANRWLDVLDARIDAVFFDRLWDAIEHADAASEPATALEQKRSEWARWLLDEAEHELRVALDAMSIPAARRVKAIAAAESAFRSKARMEFPSVFARPRPDESLPTNAREQQP